MSLNKNKKGFTIVELLIAITVIAILASIVIASFQGVQARARDVQRETDLKNIRTSLEAYYELNSTYPTPAEMTCGGYGGVSGGSTKNTYTSFIQPKLNLDLDAVYPPTSNKPKNVCVGYDQCDTSAPLSKKTGTVSYRPTDVYSYCTLKSNGVGGWTKCYGLTPGETCDYYALIFNLETKTPSNTVFTSTTGFIESIVRQ